MLHQREEPRTTPSPSPPPRGRRRISLDSSRNTRTRTVVIVPLQEMVTATGKLRGFCLGQIGENMPPGRGRRWGEPGCPPPAAPHGGRDLQRQVASRRAAVTAEPAFLEDGSFPDSSRLCLGNGIGTHLLFPPFNCQLRLPTPLITKP